MGPRCLQHPYLYVPAPRIAWPTWLMWHSIDDDIEPRGLSVQDAHHKLIDGSAKLRFLKTLLPQLKARGHRILLFSQVRLPFLNSSYTLPLWLNRSLVCYRSWFYRGFPERRRTEIFAIGNELLTKYGHFWHFPQRMEIRSKSTDKRAWMSSTNLTRMFSYIYWVPELAEWVHSPLLNSKLLNIFFVGGHQPLERWYRYHIWPRLQSPSGKPEIK